MDAAVPVDAENAPTSDWETAQNAVSHSAHTRYRFRERRTKADKEGDSTSVTKPSTESDQAQMSADRATAELATRVLMDGGMARAVAVRLVAVAAVVCGIPSAVSLAVFENQDWVWGLGLMISGLFVAVAVIRYGPARFRQELIELEPSHVRLGRLYDWTITYLIPVQFAVMFGWWMYQAVVVYDPEAWWNPIRMYSVGTCVLQWGVVLVVLRLLNDRIAAASTRPA